MNRTNELNLISLVNNIPDPEIPVLTIEDLGIVRDIQFNEQTVNVTITPTYSGCPAMEFIEKQIHEIALEAGFAAKVITVLSPAWTTDWLSEDGKKKLFEYGIAPPEKGSPNKGLLMNTEDRMIKCPQCKSHNTEMISQFGSTACKALYKCNHCLETFDYFKCI
jgi:ring-1,2-phenylacetyl-CoA epoxidase subunit PaaD